MASPYRSLKGKECFCTCVAVDGLQLTLLEVETFDGNWLVTVSGSVDDSPTSSLAKYVTLCLRIFQLCPVQKQPNKQTNTSTHTYTCLFFLKLEHRQFEQFTLVRWESVKSGHFSFSIRTKAPFLLHTFAFPSLWCKSILSYQPYKKI